MKFGKLWSPPVKIKKHALDNKLLIPKGAIGVRNTKAKLSDMDVKQIIKQLDEGVKVSTLCQMFNVCKSTIGRIKNNKSWKHLK